MIDLIDIGPTSPADSETLINPPDFDLWWWSRPDPEHHISNLARDREGTPRLKRSFPARHFGPRDMRLGARR